MKYFLRSFSSLPLNHYVLFQYLLFCHCRGILESETIETAMAYKRFNSPAIKRSKECGRHSPIFSRVYSGSITHPGPEVIKLFSCSNQLSTKFILLINVKMPTIVGILTFISMINTTTKSLKARNVFILQLFNFYDQLKFHAQLSSARKKFYNFGARA